jgi:hypothetical protein
MRAAFVLAAAASGPSDLWQSAVPVAVPGSHEECRWVEILHYVSTGGAPYRQCVRQGAALLSQILVREGRWPDCDVRPAVERDESGRRVRRRGREHRFVLADDAKPRPA